MMICKCLERKIELKPEGAFEGLESPFELEYYLIESDSDEFAAEKAYGIEIVKKADNVKVENKMVKNYSCCRQETKNILDKIADNMVTPSELLYILDDIIGI